MTAVIPKMEERWIEDEGRPTRRFFRYIFEKLENGLTSISGLASGKIWIGDASNAATAQTVTGDGTLSAGGVLTISASTGVTVANEATDTTCFPTFVTAATGSLGIKTNANLTFNSSTGVVTFASSVLTTTDINGGTVDATVIGGATPAAATVTTLSATGNVTLGDASGDTITVTGTPAGQVIGSTYSPTRSAESNLDANVTMSQAQYLRVGATVTVSGAFTADPTAPGSASFEFTLPVASNVGAVEDVAGVAFAGGIAGQGAAISGSVANNTAVVSWIAIDVTSQAWSYQLSYQVI